MAAALMGQYRFFSTFRDHALEVYVLDERFQWFDLVGYLPDSLSEHQLAASLRQILSEDWMQLMSRCRRLRFEFEWQAHLAKSAAGVEISPELREFVFQFNEALVEQPNLAALEAALSRIIRLLLESKETRQTYCVLLHNYIAPGKYRLFQLPERFKLTLEDLGELLRHVAETREFNDDHPARLADLQDRLGT